MKHFSGKEKKQLSQFLPTGYKVDKKDELIEFENVIFKNKEHFLIKFQIDNSKEFQHLPHLKSLQNNDLSNHFKTITIDVGAVPFLLKGADMMRPGITHIDDGIEKGELVIIIDEVKQLKIGVGLALFSSNEMKKMNSGKVIKNSHYFKDNFYEVNL